ncbi:MAG: hypothetical protein IPL54_16975 [Chitinophagaceae bacterium]|nr:hypothetical protein [Chitinophagaceae bacterium]
MGKIKKSEWELLRNIYKGDLKVWMWKDICVKTKEFRAWLDLNKDNLKKTGNFSNHRKYESLSGLKSNGTGAAIQSYVEWVGQSHKELINKIIISSGSDPRNLFQALYQSMSAVNRFGRTGKFDYLTMIGKLGIVFIEPPSTYMIGATGPVRGAQLLFGGPNSTPKSNNQLEILLNDLESHLGLYFGMQVLEDSLCNWQKSPTKYIYFWG